MEEVKGGLLPADLGPGRDLAMDALRRTQGAMRQRGRALGVALVLTTLSLVCLPEGKGLVEGLRKGGIPLAALFLAVSAYYWWRYLGACKRLSGTGLGPAKSLKARLAWMFGGWFVGVAIGELAFSVFQFRFMNSSIVGWLVAGIALWAGNRVGELSDEVQVRTVHTLFGHDNFDDDQGNG
jgi:hypothetical protein